MAKNTLNTLILFLAAMFALPAAASAQELIFERHPAAQPDRPAFGPNHKHFVHAYVSGSAILPLVNHPEMRIIQPFSGIIGSGARYKYKLSKPISILAEAGLFYQILRFEQGPGKTFPDSSIYRSQAIHSKGVSGGLFLRVRTGQPGDYLGNFIDLGVTANAPLINTLVSKNDLISGTSGIGTSKTTRSDFTGMRPIACYAIVRLGFDRVSVIAACRMTELFERNDVGSPRFSVGFEAAILRY